MVQPQHREEDDPRDKPSRARDAAEEENFEPEDDSDLGLEEAADDLETGTLDSDAILDEALDSVIEADDDDTGSWLDDGSEPEGLSDDDLDDGDDEDEESAVAADSGGELADDWDDDFGFDERSVVEPDSGEEGLGDDGLLAGLELEQLPPLDDAASSEDEPALESDPLTADLIAALEPPAERTLEAIASGLACTRLEAGRVQVECLQQGGRPLTALACAAGFGLGCDGRALLVAAPEGAALETRPLPHAPALALAATAVSQQPGAAQALIALATPEGIVCSRDGGRSFAPARELPQADGPAGVLAFSGPASRPRLWAIAAAGALHASDDLERFERFLPGTRAVRMAADSAGGVLVVARDAQAGLRAFRSVDGGARFAPLELPVGEPERVQQVQLLGEAALCCRRAPLPQLLFFTAHEASWSELPLAEPPALLLEAAGTLHLYYFVERELRPRLVRAAPFAETLPELVLELPQDAGTPLQLAGAYHEGATHLHIGTERAWYRVVIREEGSPR